MRIAINTRFLQKQKMEGFGWYTYETIKRIVLSHPEHQFIFLFDRPFSDDFIFAPNVEAHQIGIPARHPVLFRLWFNYSITKALKKYKADIFVSPDGYLSLKTRVPSIAVIHDLNFEHHPEDLPKHIVQYYTKYFPKFAKKADRIVTVSEYSKQDLVNTYHTSKEKIDVGYNGANESIVPLTAEEVNNQRQKLTNGLPYFVFVGALTPRKNLVRLFQAFDKYHDNAKNKYPLVIVGEKYLWTKEIRDTFEGLKNKNQVIFTGHLNREELHLTLGAALTLTYVSYFEGFGIPLVEAMRAGVPVITSNKTSLPEVAGDAALICDPFSIEDIARQMNLISNDNSLREKLIEKGLKRAKEFSWDKTAEVLWEAILKVANAKGKIS